MPNVWGTILVELKLSGSPPKPADTPKPHHPPHSPSSMDEDGISPIFVVLLGIVSAAVVLTIYHCVVVVWCNSQGQGRHRIFVPGGSSGAAAGSAEFSTVQLIPPAHAYSKGEGLVSDRQSTCPVCLCDFKDGDMVRLLPECMHCFHAPCIDMWLQSHSNCPMCRAETAPASHSADSGELPEIIGVALE